MAFDQESIDRAVTELAERVNLAPMGFAEWADIPKLMTRCFPGSFSSIQNHDPISQCVRFAVAEGLSIEQQNAFAEYYHYVNPYEKYWKIHRDGQVWGTDAIVPRDELERSEFYNDWLRKTGDFDSAIGVRLQPLAEDEIRLNLHFPTNRLEIYEKPAFEILRRMRAPLNRAIALFHYLDEQKIRTASLAALVNRGDKAACILDFEGRLIEANPMFEALLADKRIFATNAGRVTLSNHGMRERFVYLLKDVSIEPAASHSRMILRAEEGDWLLSFSKIPIRQGEAITYARPAALIVTTRFGRSKQKVDLGEFRRAFGLTGAEERLCQALMRRRSLSEAAIACNISYETARTRLKDIFLKTGNTKQTDLLLMLEQFRLG